jgi:hypothetical protein
MLALFGALTGFLLFNFYPARIFMGDSGSLFIGFMVATASVFTTAKSETLVGFALPVLVLGIPIFDTLLSILRRFLNRRVIMSPDRGHFHHRLLDRGFKQHQVAIIAYLITAVAAGLGLLMLLIDREASLALFLFGLMAVLLVFRAIGSFTPRETLQSIRARIKLARAQRAQQKTYQEADMAFRTVEGFEQWWDCMCEAANALGFSRLCLKMNNNGSGQQVFDWHRDESLSYSHRDKKEVVESNITVKSKANGHQGRLEMDVIQDDSLESARRRAMLFARLADEHGLEPFLARQ